MSEPANQANHSAKPKIGIVEDDSVLKAFYSKMIKNSGDLELAFSSSSLENARDHLSKNRIDLCIVDLGLPDGSGLSLIPQLKSNDDCKVLVATVLGDRETVMTALRSGADGYILKSMSKDQILDHVRQTLLGNTPISPQIARYLIELLHTQPNHVALAETSSPLSEREVELLTVFSRGLSYDEAATAIGVSSNTVRAHVKKIYAKLKVHSRSEALFEAATLGLLPNLSKQS